MFKKQKIYYNLHKIQLIHDSRLRTFEIRPALPLENYSNKYIWVFVITDLVYNLQKDYNTFFEIPHRFYAEQYKNDYSLCINSEEGLIFKSEHVKADIVGFFGNYWDSEFLITMHCCSFDKTIHDFRSNCFFSVSFTKNGEGLFIHYSSSFSPGIVQAIIEKTHSLYGLGMDITCLSGECS